MAFTLVFKGSIGKFLNPFMTETPFGLPYAAGIGDAFERIDELEELLYEAGVQIPNWTERRVPPSGEVIPPAPNPLTDNED